MNENSGAPDPEQGLYRKYDVTRLNDPAGKHKDCTYYILDLDHDPHSVAALLAYAKSCEAQYPTLAFDLRRTAAATARKLDVDTLPTEELRTPEPQGTFACSVCGLDTPHWHDVDVVNRERVIERVVRPAFEKAYTELARAFPDIRVSGWVGGFQRRQEKDAPDPPLNPSLIAGWYSRWPDDSFAPLVGEYKNPIIQALWRLWLRARESSVLSPLAKQSEPK